MIGGRAMQCKSEVMPPCPAKFHMQPCLLNCQAPLALCCRRCPDTIARYVSSMMVACRLAASMVTEGGMVRKK